MSRENPPHTADDALAGLQAILAETTSPAALRRSLRISIAACYGLGIIFGLGGLIGVGIALASPSPAWALAPLLFGAFGVTIATTVIRQHSRILRRLAGHRRHSTE